MYENLDYVLVNGQFIPATNPFYYCSSLTDQEQYTVHHAAHKHFA